MPLRMPSRPAAALGLCLVLVALASACAPEPAAPEPAVPEPAVKAPAAEVPQGWAEELRAWQDRREQSLLEPGGWLSLVGLHWLDEGANTFGAAPGNDLVFPGAAPAEVGTFHREASPEGVRVRVAAAPGADLRLAAGAAEDGGMDFTVTGGPVSGRDLAPDTSGEPTVLALGSLRFWVVERGDRLGVRVVDLESPALAGFVGLAHYPPAATWRVAARLERAQGATVAMPNVLGQVEELPAPGTLVFAHPDSGRELRLVPTEAAGGGLFVVFGDGTNRDETYGGGRFLYTGAPDAEGRVVLDFNRAYNPPCAFTPYATCPLPPEPNKLAARIEAGEKRYAGEVPH